MKGWALDDLLTCKFDLQSIPGKVTAAANVDNMPLSYVMQIVHCKCAGYSGLGFFGMKMRRECIGARYFSSIPIFVQMGLPSWHVCIRLR